MLTSFSSNAITAKARGIYGKRLTSQNYSDLIRQRTVADVAGYLKNNTSYNKYLKFINELQIHRGQLETLLHRSKMEKYFSLCNYDFTRNKGFYRYVIINAEVLVILRAIMLINSNSTDDIIIDLPLFMQEYACFDFKKLSNVKDFSSLLKVLEGTPYKKVLEKFNAPNSEINFSACELNLKTFYYESIFKLIQNNYKGKTRDELIEIINIEIELLNLSLIFRLKNYFNRTNEEIKAQLLPFHYKLNKKNLDLLLEPVSNEEFLKRMRLKTYNSSMKDVEFNYIEDYTKRLMYILNKKLLRFSSKAPISFYAIMALMQIEIENIIIIIEGIRYQNSPSDISKLLILK